MSTPQSKSSAAIEVEPVDKLVFGGWLNQFQKVFGCVSTISNSSDGVDAIKKKLKTGNVEYPYAIFSIASFGMDDRYTSQMLARRGLDCTITTDQRRSYRVRVIPTRFELELEFKTNSFRDVMAFARNWMFSVKQGGLKYNVQFGQLKLDIAVELADTISVPKREANPSETQEYAVTSSVIVHGYMSDATMREQPMITSVQIAGLVSNQDDYVIELDSVTGDLSAETKLAQGFSIRQDTQTDGQDAAVVTP